MSQFLAKAPVKASVKTLVKKVIEPLNNQLKQGLTRNGLSWSLAAGFVLATFPVFGMTSLLCVLVAARFSLNQVAIQLANYLAYPLQFLLFIPLIRIGEVIFGLSPVSIVPETVVDQIWSEPSVFVHNYGLAVGAACAVWLLLLVPSVWTLRQVIFRLVPARFD